jgi:alcohol dehydrogenase class IV
MKPFEYTPNPSRVIFGPGSIDKVPEELQRLNASSPLLLSTPSRTEWTDKLSAILRAAAIEPAGALNTAVTHTPVSVTLEAMDFLVGRSADCIVSIGGGSVAGLGKAISVRTGLPHLCLPTTYSGSEMTPILGETDQGNKVTRSDPKILPAVVIYDVDLTMTLPPAICTTSGVNAITHAVEALYAKNKNPITSMLALEGIKALAEVLPQIAQGDPANSLREQALYGAWLCGTCLGNSTMAIHHKLCHMLGGSFGLPHSETHTIILPHSLAYNAPAVPEQMKRLAEVLPESDGDALRGLNILLERTQAPKALKDFGFRESDINSAVEKAMSTPYPNPRALEEKGLRKLLYRAWAGETARADM